MSNFSTSRRLGAWGWIALAVVTGIIWAVIAIRMGETVARDQHRWEQRSERPGDGYVKPAEEVEHIKPRPSSGREFPELSEED